MKIFRIGFVVSTMAFASVGVLNCSSSDSKNDSNGGSGGDSSGGGSGGKGGSGGGSASGGSGGGSASGGGGGSASGGGGGSATGGKGGSGGAAGGAGGAAGGGAGGATGGAGGAGGAAGGAGGTAALSFATDIKALVTTKCGGCHKDGGQPNITDHAKTLENAAHAMCTGKKRYECMAILTQSGTMPKGGGTLTADEKAKIKAWADAGGKP